MDSAWKTLLDAGVPMGAVRQRPRDPLPDERIRSALCRVSECISDLEPPARDALYAWLRALEGQWPTAYRRWAGRVGDRLQKQILEASRDFDDNRYLKLRRIAMENLTELA